MAGPFAASTARTRRWHWSCGEPLGMLRKFATETLLAESRRDADVDQFHRVMGRMAGEK